jgi:hypothetical protein
MEGQTPFLNTFSGVLFSLLGVGSQLLNQRAKLGGRGGQQHFAVLENIGEWAE